MFDQAVKRIFVFIYTLFKKAKKCKTVRIILFKPLFCIIISVVNNIAVSSAVNIDAK